MRRLLVVVALGLVASSARGAVDPRADPKGWLDALDKATVPADGWTVGNVRVELGGAHLEIESGTLVAVGGPAARAQEFLFFGNARFALATDDPVESYQLELFTGATRLDEPITRAVLTVAADDVADGLSARPGRSALSPEQSRQAQDLLAAWRGSREYRRSGLRLRALADAVGEPTAQLFAAAWCEAPRLGRFLLRVDPYAEESLVVQQFVPVRLGDLDKDSWRHWLRREQSEGRRLNLGPDDYGSWDVWYAAALRSADGARAAGRSAFEPEHYDLEVRIDHEITSITGRADVDLTGRMDAARMIELSLHPDLEVDSIALRGGPSLPWARSSRTIVAVLPAPAASGSKLSIQVRYHGVLYERNDENLNVKRTTTEWYPRVGTIDRATYRAVIESPEPWVVLASGHKLEDAAGDGGRRQVRQLDKPSAFFGFEIGKFKIVERTLGHVALTIGFLSDQRTASASEREAAIATITAALSTYEERFGPYPLDELTVATTRYGFAQGFLGFVTLADDVVQGVDITDTAALEKRRLIAHELAHQWWGNLVGWASDRDVWLSESLANYAAAFFRRKVAQGTDLAGSSAFLDLIATAEFQPETAVGRPVEAMGPITLGPRLNSSLSNEAYHAVVYQKGSKVLAMLAEQLGEEQFLAMLKEIAQRANFRPLDTETVLAALAKMSGRNLDAFTRSFVHGVGYPQLHYDYALEPTDGGFMVRGSIHQVPRGFRRDRLVRAGAGGFDLASSFHPYQSEQEAQTLVPGVVTIEEAAGAGAVTSTSLRGFKVLLKVSGADTPFAFKVPQKPKALHLDPRTMLPTIAVNATLEPKRSGTLWAEALRSVGRAEDARAAYGKALALTVDVPADPAPPLRESEVRRRTDDQNGLIHLDLAEMALDDGRFDDAAAEFHERTVAIVTEADADLGFRLKVLRARLAIHGGDSAGAYKLLNGTLALEVMQKETDTAFDALHKNKLNSGWYGEARDYLVYAAAAHATGHEDVCREAAAEAKRRGGDASLLDESHAGAR
jgi:hypothetical protein